MTQYHKMQNLFLRQSYLDSWEDYNRSINKENFIRWDYVILTASNEARARRRVAELLAKGIDATYEDILRDMTLRDENDRTRAVAPAIPAEDAVFLDNSDLTAEETVDAVLRIIEEKTTKESTK